MIWNMDLVHDPLAMKDNVNISFSYQTQRLSMTKDIVKSMRL